MILEHWDDNVLDRFLAEWNAIPLRPQVQLPYSPIQCREAITAETCVRLATTSQLSFLPGKGDMVSFSANGIWWECSSSLVPALGLLRNNTSYSIRKLCAELPDTDAAPKLTAFLTGLAMGGAVWIESRETPNDRS